MSTTRVRTKHQDVSKGTAWYKSTGIPLAGSGGTIRIGTHGCTDVVRKRSEGDNQPLTIYHYVQEGGVLNGSGVNIECHDFYPVVYDSWGNFPHHTGLPNNPSDAYVANSVTARTNPSRPYVDLPSEVLQLTDFLYLIRRLGKTWIRKIAQSNINYQFGIAPLIGDLAKISNFMNQFGHRMKEMRRLQSVRGYRRTVDVGVYSKSGVYDKIVQSQGVFFHLDYSANTTERVWGHTRWIPSGDFKRLDAHHTRLMTSRVMLGLASNGIPKIDMKTLWEIIPWSWLIDYAIDIGGFFRANRNTIGCSNAGVYVMRETTTVYTGPKYVINGITHSKVTITRIDRTRKKVTVSPFAQVPVMTAGQLSILASLSVRGRR